MKKRGVKERVKERVKEGGVRRENLKIPIDETNFPDDVLDSEFAAYNGNSIVNSTSWSV